MRELLYVADPMCSWCYGFAPTWERVRETLAPGVTARLVLGGLAPDSDEPMPAPMQAYVQRAWRAVEERTGQPFDHAFWERNVPRRSTWIACRACLAAEELRAGAGLAMFGAIQTAYYMRARNPSEVEVLMALAEELGLATGAFRAALDADATHARLREDFALRDRLGASGFPSLGLRDGDRPELLLGGWAPTEAVERELTARGLLRRRDA